jgi:hypothetical protein
MERVAVTAVAYSHADPSRDPIDKAIGSGPAPTAHKTSALQPNPHPLSSRASASAQRMRRARFKQVEGSAVPCGAGLSPAAVLRAASNVARTRAYDPSTLQVPLPRTPDPSRDPAERESGPAPTSHEASTFQPTSTPVIPSEVDEGSVSCLPHFLINPMAHASGYNPVP